MRISCLFKWAFPWNSVEPCAQTSPRPWEGVRNATYLKTAAITIRTNVIRLCRTYPNELGNITVRFQPNA
eukprot:4026599-Pyramimonas_sp.AAC.1